MERSELLNMKKGTNLLLQGGQVVEFEDVKQKKFTGRMNGKLYNIPIDLIVRVATSDEEFDSLIEKPRVKETDNKKVFDSLVKGDYFYINSGKRNNAELYIFDSITDSRVIGINPITNAKVKISKNFNFYRLEK